MLWGHLAGRAVRSSEISDTVPLPWASAELATLMLMKHWGKKKELLWTICQSAESREWVTALQRWRRRRKKQKVTKSPKWVILQLFPPRPPHGNGCSLPFSSLVHFFLFNVLRQIDCVQLKKQFEWLQPHGARQHHGLQTFISAANSHSYNSRCFKFFFSPPFPWMPYKSELVLFPPICCLLPAGGITKILKTIWNPSVVPASLSEWVKPWFSMDENLLTHFPSAPNTLSPNK